MLETIQQVKVENLSVPLVVKKRHCRTLLLIISRWQTNHPRWEENMTSFYLLWLILTLVMKQMLVVVVNAFFLWILILFLTFVNCLRSAMMFLRNFPIAEPSFICGYVMRCFKVLFSFQCQMHLNFIWHTVNIYFCSPGDKGFSCKVFELLWNNICLDNWMHLSCFVAGFSFKWVAGVLHWILSFTVLFTKVKVLV